MLINYLVCCAFWSSWFCSDLGSSRRCPACTGRDEQGDPCFQSWSTQRKPPWCSRTARASRSSNCWARATPLIASLLASRKAGFGSVGLFRFWEAFNDLVYKTIGNVFSLYIESSMVCDMSKLHEEDISIRKSLLVCLHAFASHF